MTKVLLAEDSILICKIVEKMLEGEYEVSIEHNGNDVIDKVRSIQPDVILLSLILDGKHGFEICKDLKQDEELKDIPVIFVTSSSDEKLVLQGFACGAVDYVVKPFKRLELTARVKCHSVNKHLNDQLKANNQILQENLRLQKEYAIRDSMTNLYNRRYALEQLGNDFRQSTCMEQEGYIFLADIDNFKSVNDMYGHAIGDHVIKVVCEIITKYMAPSGFVSRWGGEEILAVTYNITEEQYLELCQNLLKSIEDFPFSSENGIFHKTITIGATQIDYKKSIEENINDADDALYHGKNNGKNKIIMAKKT